MRIDKDKSSSTFMNLFKRPEAGVLVATVVLFVFFSIGSDIFLSPPVLSNILLLSAELGMIAIGVTLLMIAGEFYLSVGSVMGLSSAIMILMLNSGVAAPISMISAILICTCIGVTNGLLVTRLRIHSLIITLAGLMFYRAFVLYITAGYPLRLTEKYTFLKYFYFRWDFMGIIIPGTFLWFLLFLIILAIILGTTKFGNWCFAAGGNPEAAKGMGVPVMRVKVMCFALASTMAALAGCIQGARYNSVDALRGTGIELEAVFCVVVGGAALTGGYGSIIGAALGVIIISIVKQGLVLMDIPAYWFRAGIGVVLVVAAVINQKVRESSSK